MAAQMQTHAEAVSLRAPERFAAERQAQRAWADTPVRHRLQVLRRFRAELAAGAEDLAATVPLERAGRLHRSIADTFVAELLPLAEACRFLEREAAFVLRTRREDSRNRPFWLGGVQVLVERAPLGLVLVIGPANYPLFLPGVQTLQALAAGNAVLWKPAPGCHACAHATRTLLLAGGLPPEVLTILDSSADAAQRAINAGVDKVVLTGSAATGEAVQHQLAASATPAVMELSGCDAVFVLEGAEIAHAVEAIVFGLRFNGSATCMAPRRVFVAAALEQELLERLAQALAALPRQVLPPVTCTHLRELVLEASLEGARILLDGLADRDADGTAGPTLLTNVTPQMRVAASDIFAPVLSVMRFRSLADAAAMDEKCPYALTASIFGPERDAMALAAGLTAGVILLNDVIVSTADPRASFGGRRRSGYGVTRGREGLLAMTAPKTIVRRRGRSTRAYQPTGPAHSALFAAYLQAAHGGGWRTRLRGLRALGRAASGLRQTDKQDADMRARKGGE